MNRISSAHHIWISPAREEGLDDVLAARHKERGRRVILVGAAAEGHQIVFGFVVNVAHAQAGFVRGVLVCFTDKRKEARIIHFKSEQEEEKK